MPNALGGSQQKSLYISTRSSGLFQTLASIRLRKLEWQWTSRREHHEASNADGSAVSLAIDKQTEELWQPFRPLLVLTLCTGCQMDYSSLSLPFQSPPSKCRDAYCSEICETGDNPLQNEKKKPLQSQHSNRPQCQRKQYMGRARKDLESDPVKARHFRALPKDCRGGPQK